MAKLTDYSAVTRFDSDGILITDGTSGTKKISVQDAAKDFAGMVSAIQHRNTFIPKNLGTLNATLKQQIKESIASGTYDNLFVGHYVVIDGKKHYFADFGRFKNCGDTNFTANNALMVTDVLYNAVMNDTNTTEGGYVGSKMRTEGLDAAKSTISSAWGDMLLTSRQYLCNAVTNGYPSAGAWFDSQVELLNEVMVYGCRHLGSMNKGSADVKNDTCMKQQVSLFRLAPEFVDIRATYWLQDVVSSTSFALVGSNGAASIHGASSSLGVRPWYLIG